MPICLGAEASTEAFVFVFLSTWPDGRKKSPHHVFTRVVGRPFVWHVIHPFSYFYPKSDEQVVVDSRSRSEPRMGGFKQTNRERI